MLKLSFYNKLIVGLQSTTKVVGYFIQFFYLLQWQQWRITIFRALGRDKLRGCGPNCYTIKTKNTFNQNYILNQINQFMLLYKDMNIEHENDT